MTDGDHRLSVTALAFAVRVCAEREGRGQFVVERNSRTPAPYSEYDSNTRTSVDENGSRGRPAGRPPRRRSPGSSTSSCKRLHVKSRPAAPGDADSTATSAPMPRPRLPLLHRLARGTLTAHRSGVRLRCGGGPGPDSGPRRAPARRAAGRRSLQGARTRPAPLRSTCTKQLGICVWTHHGAQGHFPAAAVPTPAGLPPEDRLGWLVPLIPYYSNDPDFNKLDMERGSHTRRTPSWPASGRSTSGSARARPTGRAARTDRLRRHRRVGCRRADAAGQQRPSRLHRILPRAEGGRRQAGHQPAADGGRSAQLKGAWTAAGPPTARGLDAGEAGYIARAASAACTVAAPTPCTPTARSGS